MEKVALPVLDPNKPSPGDDARELAKLMRGEVRFGAHDRMLYSTDASIYQMEPLGVVVPADVDDVRRVIAFCSERGLPILPRGGGTSLAGQCVNRAIVVDVSAHLNALVRLDEAQRQCVVEPGITIAGLNALLRPSGLFFAPDPATVKQANIGGCIGNNAAGTRSIRYGRTSENTLGASLELATGESVGFGSLASGNAAEERLVRGVVEIVGRHREFIRSRFPKTLRRNAGYALDMILAQMAAQDHWDDVDWKRIDLTPLICGSEGTLGFVTQAALKLHPIPAAQGLAVLAFDSVEAAIDSVEAIVGLNPSAVELLDDLILSLARDNAQCQRMLGELAKAGVTGEPAAVLYVEFLSATSVEEVRASMQALGALADSGSLGTCGFTYLDKAQQVEAAMGLRRAGEPLLHAIAGSRKPVGFVEDNAVPPAKLGMFVRGFRAIMDAEGTRASFYAHASVGVLHVRPLLDLRCVDDLARMERIAVATAELARELGGVMSGEHGDGRSRGPLLEAFFGRELMGAFREVKALFDPSGMFNPGNIVEPGAIATIHEHTRIEAAGAMIDDAGLYFDHSADGGFGHAVEKCNGAGVCRKAGEGTMCPSYMALRDERHSTRGRGNALRLAISGQLASRGGARWADRETLETLDLCLSCKACGSECPSSVDVAKYKAEYVAQSRGMGAPVSLRDRVLGSIDVVNRLGSAVWPVANAVGRFGPSRWVTQRVLGMAPGRGLPAFSRRLSKRWDGARAEGACQSEDRPRVILFADCFTNHMEPEIGLATQRVLRALGYDVVLFEGGCCGRAAISTGNLARARLLMEQTASVLIDAVDRWGAERIVVCEPSCLSSLKDDWRTLKSRVTTDDRRRIAELSTMPEALVGAELAQRGATMRWKTGDRAARRTMVHTHCHQRALWGTGPGSEAIMQVAGADGVDVPDLGCCGMAGGFGYAQHRYDLSMAIGRDRLFPAVERLGGDGVVVAAGTSCRQQILDGTGRRAVHPMQWLSDRLED